MLQEVDLTRITAQAGFINGVHQQTYAHKRQVFSQNMHVRATKEHGCLEFKIELSKILKACLIDPAFLSEYCPVF